MQALREVLKNKLSCAAIQPIYKDCLDVVLDSKTDVDIVGQLNRIDMGAGEQDIPSKTHFALQALVNLLDTPVK